MIKEKYQWYISIFTLILAIIFIFSFGGDSKISVDNNDEKKLQVVLNKDEITDINIDINETDWKWLKDNASKEEFRSCNITIGGQTYYNVGIRPKGNSSLSTVVADETTDRYSFKIKFDEYVDGQTYNGIESIVLNNMIQDNTYMKEYISYDLYDFMGIAVPEMSYSNIKINNEDWGLYLAIEVIDERYLENNFGTTEGNLYKPETMGMRGGQNGKGGNNFPQMGNPPQMSGMPNPPMMEQGNDNKDMQAKPDNDIGNMPTMNDAGQAFGDVPQNEDADKENNDGNKTNPEQNGGNPGPMAGGPGGNDPEGADFAYIDDEVSSYSIVRDSAVFKRTTDADFKKVINMFKNLNDGTNIEEVLDVEEVLKYFAVNTYLINLDSYSGAMYHNYYLYENNGVCQILPWDLNLSFGGFQGMGGKGPGESSETTSIINFPIDNPVTGNLEDMPLIGKLLENDEYKELYHSYLKEIADNYFNSGHYAELVNKLDSMINEYVKEDKTAFCTYEQYQASIPQMILFGEERTNSVLAQLSGEQPSTTYGNIESTVDMSLLTSKMGPGGGHGGPGGENREQGKNGENKIENNNGAPQGGDLQVNNNANDGENINPMNNQNPQEGIDENKQNQGHPGFPSQQQQKTDIRTYILFGGLLCFSVIAVFFVSRFKRRKI